MIIVTGHPRSGTTLLGQLMHSHPDIAVTHEFGMAKYAGQSLFPYIRSMIERIRIVDDRWGIDHTVGEGQKIKMANKWLAARYLMNIVRTTRGVVDFKAIENAMKLTYPGANVVGDKTPGYSSNLQRYVEQDGLSVIYIYRDCRDVTSSFLVKTRTEWRDQEWVQNWKTAEAVAHRWVGRIEAMERWADKMLVIKYEDLVTDPERVLPPLASLIDIDVDGFDAGMLRPTSIGNYRKTLTDAEVADVMTVAGPTMDRLGYV